jgi:hypothetical protein
MAPHLTLTPMMIKTIGKKTSSKQGKVLLNNLHSPIKVFREYVKKKIVGAWFHRDSRKMNTKDKEMPKLKMIRVQKTHL